MSATAAAVTIAIALASLNGVQANLVFTGTNSLGQDTFSYYPASIFNGLEHAPKQECTHIDHSAINNPAFIVEDLSQRVRTIPGGVNNALPGTREKKFTTYQWGLGRYVPSYKKLTVAERTGVYSSRFSRTSNTVAIGSCAANCATKVTGNTLQLHCHDPLVAPKCAVRSNNFTQSRNTNATMPKQYRNSNKIKSWRAKPKF